MAALAAVEALPAEECGCSHDNCCGSTGDDCMAEADAAA